MITKGKVTDVFAFIYGFDKKSEQGMKENILLAGGGKKHHNRKLLPDMLLRNQSN